MKACTVDAQTDPLGLIVMMKLYEVQTYLSLTNHWWSGFSVVANAQAWKALPPDLQAIIENVWTLLPSRNGKMWRESMRVRLSCCAPRA